jgi:predicted CXXCH cytochrome family protein
MVKKGTILWLSVIVCILCGCDPVTRYKVTSTIFDGVPRMPPAEEYCREYHVKASAEEREAEKKKESAEADAGSSKHPPYAEKRCNDCHDKNTDSGFIAPANQLCGVCHKNFITSTFVHGPASVGSCLNCHVPHNSQYPSLLKKSPEEICRICHAEARLAKGMHDAVHGKGLVCIDCHDPHGGNNNFFLK